MAAAGQDAHPGKDGDAEAGSQQGPIPGWAADRPALPTAAVPAPRQPGTVRGPAPHEAQQSLPDPSQGALSLYTSAGCTLHRAPLWRPLLQQLSGNKAAPFWIKPPCAAVKTAEREGTDINFALQGTKSRQLTILQASV